MRRPQSAEPVGDTVRPPLGLLAIAAVAIVLSFLLLGASGKAVNLLGYFLSMIVAALAIAGYRTIEGRRRSRAGYVEPRLAGRIPVHLLAWVLLALGIVIGAAHVWRFADAVAR